MDNFDSENPYHWRQRYWYNDDYWDPVDGPIFLYLCGEWTCSPPSVNGTAFSLGAKLKAKLVALEHRYYGDSQPTETWSYEDLKLLSAPQALADAAHFIKNTWNDRQRKWVVIGGSYPGALSAWFKSQYPDLTVASWSSSGVINAI